MDTLATFAQATIKTGQQINIPNNTADANLLTGTVLPLIFMILGALSLLFVVIGGFRYVISAGDPSNTAKARETILYALIGLVVSVSAFSIVRFVLANIKPDEAAATGGLVGATGIITQATQFLVYVTGAVSVIMIIYGAIRYVVSGGDPSGTKSARDTILYAAVGLVVAVGAQAIVTFILKAL